MCRRDARTTTAAAVFLLWCGRLACTRFCARMGRIAEDMVGEQSK